MLQYTTISSCRQDFWCWCTEPFFLSKTSCYWIKSVSSYCYRNIKLNCSFTLLWPCIRYAFTINVWVVWLGGTHPMHYMQTLHFKKWASICMWFFRDLRVSLLFLWLLCLPPSSSVPFQLDTVPSCSCSDHDWPGIQDHSTVGGLWLYIKSVPVSPRVYSSMCTTIKNKFSTSTCCFEFLLISPVVIKSLLS